MRVFALLIALATLFVVGCGAKPEIEKIVLTDQVDSSKQPVRQVESFPEGTKAFYVAVSVLNPSKGTEVRVRWLFEEKPVDEFTFEMPDAKDRWVAFNLKASQAFPRGRYRAEVYLSDTLVRNVEFSVN